MADEYYILSPCSCYTQMLLYFCAVLYRYIPPPLQTSLFVVLLNVSTALCRAAMLMEPVS